jgi:hypothetical protein
MALKWIAAPGLVGAYRAFLICMAKVTDARVKKFPAKQTSRCWPGYTPVPGTKRGEKGSCEPKAHPTKAEKKADAMAAAATKLRKAGGNKVGANRAA